MFDSFGIGAVAAFPAADTTSKRTCDAVIALVSNQKHVPVQLLVSRARGRLAAARARQLAMYLSHVVLGRTLTEIGDAFGRDRTTVSYACALIEDMRDDPAFDAEVTGLEGRLEAMDEGRAVDA